MVLGSELAVFGVGLAGGAANEVLHWWSLRESPQLPVYARRIGYWAITACMILLGGGLAYLQLGSQADALIAFQIGLAAPMLLQKLAKATPTPRGAMGTDSASIRQFLAG